METKRILVIGGTGYIGKEIVSILAKTSYDVTVLSRHSGNIDGIRYLKGSILDREYLMHFLKDFDLVINLASVVRTINKRKYKENTLGLRNVIDSMKKNNIKKIVYFSTQNVHILKTGYYGNSKKECEKIIKDSELDYIIVRPNYVYGLDKENDFYRLFKIMKIIKIAPIIGNGRSKIQPVNKKDVAKLTSDILKDWRSREEINISGKTTISLLQIADLIKRKKKMHALIIHIPLFLFKPLKWIIPFDLEGYNQDRISPDTIKTMIGCSDFEEDIQKITSL